MPTYDNQNGDVFDGSSSHLLSARSSSPRKSPSRRSLSTRPSTASLRASSSKGNIGGEETANGRGQHSLAHELAVALMPEPSASSKLLAEEFGIEYDEGAEGIDDDDVSHGHQAAVDDISSFVEELVSQTDDSSSTPPVVINGTSHDDDDEESSVGSMSPGRPMKQPEQDAMIILAQNLESTDKFLAHLRRLDVDSGSSVTHQPVLEKLASDVIRRINDTARDREGQVRELLGYEREFRRIAGEVGGSEALGQLDELEPAEDLSEKSPIMEAPRTVVRPLSFVEEDPPNDWETDPERNYLGDEDKEFETGPRSPIKDSFPAPPPMNGSPTPAKAIPQLAHIRTFTTSLVSSLTTISEQAQVNGAATTDAGRKIRALKNKLGGWRMDWDSAEVSRLKIEQWEAGIVDGEAVNGINPTSHARRIDGRKVVADHLAAFELALAEAGLKTQAIMATS